MKVIGIIVEYNPLHDGHKYHIKKIKEKYPDENILIIAVMSGNVVQRGEFSIISKFDRTKLAIDNGVDIVVQLPTYYSLNSAKLFAKGSIEILSNFKVEEIIFGSEQNDINKLDKISNLMMDDKFDSSLKEEVKKIQSYPRAIENILKEKINSNDILGINYLYWIKKNKTNIKFDSIERNFSFPSATNIRLQILTNKDFQKKYNLEKKQIINMKDFIDNFIFNLEVLNKNESVFKYIKNNIINKQYNSWDDFLNNFTNTSFTKSNISRQLLKLILNINEIDCEIPRVLGFSQKGKEYLKHNKNKIKFHSKYKKEYTQDLKIAKLLDIIYKGKFVEEEINKIII